MKRKLQLAAILLTLGAILAGTAVAASSPGVVTDSAIRVGLSTAVLRGAVNPNGAPTSYQFQFGLTTAYGLTSAAGLAGGGGKPIQVRESATGLIPGTVYPLPAGCPQQVRHLARSRQDLQDRRPPAARRGHGTGDRPRSFGRDAHRGRQSQRSDHALVVRIRPHHVLWPADDGRNGPGRRSDDRLSDGAGPRVGHHVPLPTRRPARGLGVRRRE